MPTLTEGITFVKKLATDPVVDLNLYDRLDLFRQLTLHEYHQFQANRHEDRRLKAARKLNMYASLGNLKHTLTKM